MKSDALTLLRDVIAAPLFLAGLCAMVFAIGLLVAASWISGEGD